MPHSSKYFLVGLPGSGKSTLGKQLAKQLELPFIDLDDAIEARAKKPIRDIFAQQGEDYFRKLESDILQNIITQESSFVMATGGGTPCFLNNMARMNQAGVSIFVDTPVSVIAERMKKEGVEVRPLLQELDTDNFTEAYHTKFAYRLPYYQQASVTIASTDDIDAVLATLRS